MSNENIAAEVICPYFFVTSDQRGDFRITCEGIDYSKYNTIRFSTKEEKLRYINENCKCYPNECKIAKLVDEKYV